MDVMERRFEDLREALVAERAVLIQQIKQEKTLTGWRDGDDVDLSTFDRDSDLRWKIEEHESDRLLDIDDALLRMDARTYGICELCGEDISLARLAAVPVAKLCISCQTDSERQHASEGESHEVREMMTVEDVWGSERLTLRVV